MLPHTYAIKYAASKTKDGVEASTDLISATLGHQLFDKPYNGDQGNEQDQYALYPYNIQKFDPATQAVVFFFWIDWVFCALFLFSIRLIIYL